MTVNGYQIAESSLWRIARLAELVVSHHPYLLRFRHNDVQGRLRQGDLILISQAADAEAEISVVRFRKKSFLARRSDNGSWVRVANGPELPPECPVTGCCMGVWSPL